MEQKSVLIEIPESLYERIKKAADDNDQPIETVMLNGLAIIFAQLPQDRTLIRQTLSRYTDDQLWFFIQQRMLHSEESQLDDLVAKAKRDTLPPDEKAELETLVERVNYYTLVRTHALVLLEQRSYELNINHPVKV